MDIALGYSWLLSDCRWVNWVDGVGEGAIHIILLKTVTQFNVQ